MNQCAFDYDKQEWIEGASAIPVLLAQRRQELELLSGPDGERFARFTAVADRPAAMRWLRAEIARLEGGAS